MDAISFMAGMRNGISADLSISIVSAAPLASDAPKTIFPFGVLSSSHPLPVFVAVTDSVTRMLSPISASLTNLVAGYRSMVVDGPEDWDTSFPLRSDSYVCRWAAFFSLIFPNHASREVFESIQKLFASSESCAKTREIPVSSRSCFAASRTSDNAFSSFAVNFAPGFPYSLASMTEASAAHRFELILSWLSRSLRLFSGSSVLSA